MRPLTDRQQAILDFIRARIARDGASPSLAEVCEAFGFASSNAARKHLQALAARGVIRMVPGHARGIRLVESADVPQGAGLRVPVLGRVAAGPPIGAGGEVEGYVLLDPTLFRPTPDYLLRVRGDSMQDGGILDGDLIAVRRTGEAVSGQTVVARIDGELTVKRLEILDGRLRLLARNPDYPPIEITPEIDDFAIEGLLIGLVRSV